MTDMHAFEEGKTSSDLPRFYRFRKVKIVKNKYANHTKYANQYHHVEVV